MQLQQQLMNGISLAPYIQLLNNNTFHHFNPLFNKTTYQCVGPLPGHKFVWVYLRIQKRVYAYKHKGGQAYFLIEFFFALCVYLEVYMNIQEDGQLQL